jgi:very-short-patch-repair endonuclease
LLYRGVASLRTTGSKTVTDDLRLEPSTPLPQHLVESEELAEEYRRLRADITGRGQSKPVHVRDALAGLGDDEVVRAVDPLTRRQRHSRQDKEAYAKHLRDHMTLAEWTLWQHLQHWTDDGIAVEAQAIVHGWIVDFYIPSVKLVIEIDGGIHNGSAQYQRDQHKNAILKREGYTVLRFRNPEAMHRTAQVVAQILDTIAGMEAHDAG